MSNVNSFASVNISVTPLPTTETIALFPGRAQDGVGTPTRANSMLGLDNDLLQGGRFDGRPFRIVLAGQAVASASENFTFAVYLNNATTANTNLTTFTNDIKICTGTTIATGAAGTVAFYYSVIGIWNAKYTPTAAATTGRFAFVPEMVQFYSISGTSAVSAVTPTIGNSGTAITTTAAACQFYVTTLTGTADTTSAASLDFHLDSI